MNKAVVADQLRDKFSNQCYRAIIMEAFINALPFDKEELPKYQATLEAHADHVLGLISNQKKVLDYHALESFMPTVKDEHVNAYMETLRQGIRQIAMEATTANLSTPPTLDAEVPFVDKAALTEEETKKLETLKKDINLPSVSALVTKKVINTLKAEKEEFDANQKLHQDLEDALQETKDYNNKSLESYMEHVLAKSDPREYVSLFSKLLDTSLEAYANYTGDDTDLALPVLESVTNQLFDASPENVMESLQAKAIFAKACENDDEDEDEKDDDDGDDKHKKKFMKKMMNASMIASITMYTMFETLKTLRLVQFNPDMIRKFMDRPTSMHVDGADAPVLQNRVDAALGYLKNDIANAKDNVVLEDKCKTLESWKNVISKLPITYKSIQEAVLPKIESLTDLAKERANILSETGTSFESTLESYQYYRNRDNTLAQFNRLAAMYGKNPNVDKIQINVTRAMEGANMSDVAIGVEALRSDGSVYDKTEVDYIHNSSAGKVLDCLRSIIGDSMLQKCAKNVNLYNIDNCKII